MVPTFVAFPCLHITVNADLHIHDGTEGKPTVGIIYLFNKLILP